MGTKERRQREKEVRRTLILKAAMDLFLREGFDKVTMRHIASAIDYSPAALYLSFSNKDEILFALHNEGFQELYRREQALARIRDPFRRLRRLGEVYIQFALENPEYYDLMFIMRGPAKMITRQKRWESGQQAFEVLRTVVRECIQAGYFQGANPDAATFALWALVHGIASMIIRSRTMMIPPESVTAMVGGALDFFGSLMRATHSPVPALHTRHRRRES